MTSWLVHANQLLGSTKPGHVNYRADRPAAKRLISVIKVKVIMFNFVWSITACANDRCCFIVSWMKLNKIHALLSNSPQFQGEWIFMQISKEYLNEQTCKFYIFLDKICKFLTYHLPIPLTTAKLSSIKNGAVFHSFIYLLLRRSSTIQKYSNQWKYIVH